MISNRFFTPWTVTKSVNVTLSMELQNLIVAPCAQLQVTLAVDQKAKKK